MSNLLVCPKCHFSAAVPAGTCPRCAEATLEPLLLSGRAVEIQAPSTRPAPVQATVPASMPEQPLPGAATKNGFVCHGCNHVMDEPLTRCPWCGGVVQSQRDLRVRGGILVLCGSFLLVFMGWITWLMTEIIRNSDKPGAKVRFSGGTVEMVIIYGVFAAVLGFGLGALIAGITQIVTGRRNEGAMRLMFWLAGALAVFAVVIEVFL